MFFDKKGVINVSLWNALADEICAIWRVIVEARKNNRNPSRIDELSKTRIQSPRTNYWNGEILTNIRTLVSIEKGQGETGTSIQVLQAPTAANLITLTYSVPSTNCCMSVFRTLRNKLRARFRVTLKGKIVDV